MPKFNKGDRVTVAADATWGCNNIEVKSWMVDPTAEVRVESETPDSDGDIFVKNANDAGFDGYVNARFVSPYVESEQEYTFDPGGERIEYADIRVGDTIAALWPSGTWRIGTAEYVGDYYMMAGSGDLATVALTDIRLLHRPVDKDVAAMKQFLGLMPWFAYKEAYTETNLTPLAEALVGCGLRAPEASE